MTISIHSEGIRFFLKLPTRLLLNHVTTSIVMKALKKKGVDIQLTAADMKKLAICIRQCKKEYRKMELVRVESANGDKVIIKL